MLFLLQSILLSLATLPHHGCLRIAGKVRRSALLFRTSISSALGTYSSSQAAIRCQVLSLHAQACFYPHKFLTFHSTRTLYERRLIQALGDNMILIAAAAAILVGFLLAPLALLIARLLVNTTTQTPTEAYFLTGILLTGSLSLTPTLFIGVPTGVGFSFLVLWVVFVAILIASRRLRIQRWNFWLLFGIAAAETAIGIWFLKAHTDVHFDALSTFILYVLGIAFFPTQLTLAIDHSKCAKFLAAQPIIPPDAARR